ncbi:MAG: hypothetical protein NTY77_09575 [Elusimicrobia bacterium]|nr:hypothetical protein [Elusimicrobiota bacterium]
MEKASPDDLHKEISRLWEKVGAASAAPADPAPTPAASVATANEVAWETVAMLKSQYRRQEARWHELLEAREKALRALKERQALLETELGSLRQKVRADDELVVAEVLDVGSRLEAAQKALADERAAHEAERRDLKALVDAARESAGAEGARWREEQRRWEKKEQQYLLDLQELQAAAARRQEDSQRAEDAAARLSTGLEQTQAALEKTLAELLRERHAHQESEGEQSQAVKRIAEVEGRCEDLSRVWEKERGQWRELWDQERSARETRRLELSSWEENLRKEREAWEARRLELAAWEENLRKEREAWEARRLELAARDESLRQERSAWEEGLRKEREASRAEVSAKDQAPVKPAEQLARSLPEASAASQKLAAVMERVAELERKLPAPSGNGERQPSGDGAPLRAAAPRRRWLGPAAVAAGLLLAAAWPLGRWLSAWSLKPLTTRGLALDHPTALASDGKRLWVSDWKGTLEAFDPADLRAPVSSASVSGIGAYRPVALALGGERFYTLDAAQARIVRHQPDDPGTVLYAKPAPGPAPTALAWDGQALWSYDAFNKRLYRHGAEETDAKAYPLEADVLPAAMQWLGGRLWLWDSRSRRLMAFDLANEAFAPAWAVALDENVVGLTAAQADGAGAGSKTEDILVLAGPSARRQGFALARYRVGWRLFTIF